MSRKTKCTPELQATICQFVAAGAPLPLAVQAAGESWNTVKDWMRAKREPYRSFANAVRQAKARWAVGVTMQITKAGQKDWHPNAWLLERRVKAFQLPSKHQVEHSGDIGLRERQMSMAELDARYAELTKGKG